MSSSYKPKLIEFFYQDKDDSLPELIHLAKVHAKQPIKHFKPVHSLNLHPQPKPKSTKPKPNPNTNSNTLLNLSSYKSNSTPLNPNLSIQIQEQYTTTSKHIPLQDQEKEFIKENEKIEYQRRIQQLEKELVEEREKAKQISGINLKLVREKERIEREFKDGKLAVSYVKGKMEKQKQKQKSGEQKVKEDIQKKVWQRVMIKLKMGISEFLENIKMEEISLSLEGKIEQFLSQLIGMCPLGEEIKEKILEKEKGKVKQGKKEKQLLITSTTKSAIKLMPKHSPMQSPIATESSFLNTKLNFEYSPYLQLSTHPNLNPNSNHSLSIQFPQQLVGQPQKSTHLKQLSKPNSKQQISLINRDRRDNSDKENEKQEQCNVARFSFVRENEIPSKQSAYISVSQIGKSYEGRDRDRSKSQRRRKIFQ